MHRGSSLGVDGCQGQADPNLGAGTPCTCWCVRAWPCGRLRNERTAMDARTNTATPDPMILFRYPTAYAFDANARCRRAAHPPRRSSNRAWMRLRGLHGWERRECRGVCFSARLVISDLGGCGWAGVETLRARCVRRCEFSRIRNGRRPKFCRLCCAIECSNLCQSSR